MQPSSLPASIGDAAIVSAASARADHMHDVSSVMGVDIAYIDGVLGNDVATITATYRLPVKTVSYIQGTGVAVQATKGDFSKTVVAECAGGWLSCDGESAVLIESGIYEEERALDLSSEGDVRLYGVSSSTSKTSNLFVISTSTSGFSLKGSVIGEYGSFNGVALYKMIALSRSAESSANAEIRQAGHAVEMSASMNEAMSGVHMCAINDGCSLSIVETIRLKRVH